MWLYYDIILQNLKRVELSKKLEDIVKARRDECIPPNFTTEKL